ncbi:hypothetical protein R6Q57_011537 [Mikania cordata]
MAKTYGPLIWLQLGSTPVVIVSSADAAREIMKTHDIIFSNRPFTSVIDKNFYGSKDVVFSPYGEYWRKLKMVKKPALVPSSGFRTRSIHMFDVLPLAGVA